MVEIEIVNVRHDKRSDVAYCGRAMPGRPRSPLANPFPISPMLTRGQAVRKYAEAFPDLRGKPAAAKELARLTQLAQQSGSLTLGCWCAPATCHTETIAAEIAMRLRARGLEAKIVVAARDRDDQTLGLSLSPPPRDSANHLDPAQDGVTHINVYSRANTELGRALSNFAHTPFECEDGSFASVEGYWYWLGVDANHPRRDELRAAHGAEAKSLGRALRAPDWQDDPEFQRKICAAIDAKLQAYHSIATALKASTLPLRHYYVFGGAVVEPSKGTWVIDHLDATRARLRTQPSLAHDTTFAVIGSRSLADDTPEAAERRAQLERIVRHVIATHPEAHCRSGGARGADSVGERAYRASGGSRMEVFRPGGRRDRERARALLRVALADSPEHYKHIAKNEAVLALHERNMQIILGEHLNDPVDFVIATAGRVHPVDGYPDGGTRTGFLLAKHLGIPAFNIQKSEDLAALRALAADGYRVDRAPILARLADLDRSPRAPTFELSYVVLGPPSIEINTAEDVLRALALPYGYAADATGRRCTSASARQATSILPASAPPASRSTYFPVACAGPAFPKYVYPKSASTGAATTHTLGSLILWLTAAVGVNPLVEHAIIDQYGTIEPPYLFALYSHRLHDVYAGKICDINPKEFLAWRLGATAQLLGRDSKALARELDVALAAIEAAPVRRIADHPVALVVEPLPELAEASAVAGLPVLTLERDLPNTPWDLILHGAPPELAAAWETQQRQLGRPVRSDPRYRFAAATIGEGGSPTPLDAAIVAIGDFHQRLEGATAGAAYARLLDAGLTDLPSPPSLADLRER